MLPGASRVYWLAAVQRGGEILQQLHLSATGPTHGIEVEEDQFHTLVAPEADSVIFELKQGPYQPAEDKDFLSGFPHEGTPEAAVQEAQWRDLLLGSGLA